MKNLKRNFHIAFLALFLVQNSIAQNVPENYKLEKKEDYAPYKEQVLENIIWLEKTPISDKNAEIRKPVQQFVMAWVAGNPDIHPPLIGNIIKPLMDESETYAAILMGRFIFGETKALMDNSQIGEVDLYTKGIESMVKAYESITPKVKLKSMEKYKKMIKDGKLKTWLEDLIK